MSSWSELDEIRALVQRYVFVSSPHADAIALWVVHTHAFAAAETTPYLEIWSAEKRSGKTRLLELLELLCARPWLTGRVTTAVLARKVDAQRSTLLLDESDAAFKGDKEYGEALRAILNSGHRRGGRASVCFGQGASIGFRDLDVFCPKAIAGIGRLPDTISDRAIKIELRRKAPDELVARFRRREAEALAEPVKQRVEGWAEVNLPKLELARPDIPEELHDRAADAWEPLLAIAQVVGGDWPERATAAARALARGGHAEDETAGVRLLADIREIFHLRACDRISTADLLAALAAQDEAPWSNWRGSGRLAAHALSKLLKPYGIRTRTIRMPDSSTPKGFKKAQFEDAWRRYLNVLAPQSATPPHRGSREGRGSGSQGLISDDVAGSERLLPPHPWRDVADVADVAAQTPDPTDLPDPDAELERLRTKFPDMFGSNGFAPTGESR